MEDEKINDFIICDQSFISNNRTVYNGVLPFDDN